jgi:Mg2+ and Co2+ transporter CorA
MHSAVDNNSKDAKKVDDKFDALVLDAIKNAGLQADELQDSASENLNLYMSLTSYRTNDMVTLLTKFSVFFTPMTFVAGVYGMNFDVSCFRYLLKFVLIKFRICPNCVCTVVTL